MNYKLAVVLALLTQASTTAGNQILAWCDCGTEVFTIPDGGFEQPKPLPSPPLNIFTIHGGDAGVFAISDSGIEQPKPLPSPPLTADNRVGNISVFGANPCINPTTKAKSCTWVPVLFLDNGKTVFTIQDGDEPIGPCNLGALVRAAKAHLEIEHPFVEEWAGRFGSQAQTLAVNYCRDYKPDSPECRVYNAEQALKRAKAEAEEEQKRINALNDFRKELVGCEPAKAKVAK